MEKQHVLLHTCTIPVRWSDIDAVGHVNNANYFTYLEQARASWLDRIGAAKCIVNPEQGPVIVTTACTFLIPVFYPADLMIKMFAGPPGSSSFETSYEIRDAADPNTLYAIGSARIVWVDHNKGRSIPLPPSIRASVIAGSGKRTQHDT